MGNQWQSRSKTHTSIPAAPVSKGVSWRRPFPEQNTHVQPKSDDKADGQAYQRRPPSNAMSRLDSSLDLPRAMKPIQTKLTVGAPGDKYEQEADQVADQVMSMPDAATQAPVQREGMPEEDELQTKPLAAAITPLVQREAMPEEEEVQTKAIGTLQREEMPEEEELQMKPIGMLQREEAMPEEEEVQAKPLGNSIQREAMPEEEEVQAKPLGNRMLQREAMPEEEEAVQAKGAPDAALPAGSNLESRLSSSQGGGSPLSNDVRSFMEPRFGADFSQVRVHTGSEAVQMNRDLNAQAFTHKQDVYFSAGKAPGNDALTAHELTHVVQQTEVSTRFRNSHLSSERCCGTNAAKFSMLKSLPLTNSFIQQQSKLEEDNVAHTERGLRSMISWARTLGWNMSADNLEKYLSGDSDDKFIDVNWLSSYQPFCNAVTKNILRFKQSFSKKAQELDDSESLTISDHWDALISANLLTDLYYASGDSTLRSDGTFNITRSGNTATVEGFIEHYWYDYYNWNKHSVTVPGFGIVYDKDVKLLEKYRGAKPYKMAAWWGQALEDKVILRGGGARGSSGI